MMRALYVSATGMQAQDKNISTITQNIAMLATLMGSRRGLPISKTFFIKHCANLEQN